MGTKNLRVNKNWEIITKANASAANIARTNGKTVTFNPSTVTNVCKFVVPDAGKTKARKITLLPFHVTAFKIDNGDHSNK